MLGAVRQRRLVSKKEGGVSRRKRQLQSFTAGEVDNFKWDDYLDSKNRVPERYRNNKESS